MRKGHCMYKHWTEQETASGTGSWAGDLHISTISCETACQIHMKYDSYLPTITGVPFWTETVEKKRMKKRFVCLVWFYFCLSSFYLYSKIKFILFSSWRNSAWQTVDISPYLSRKDNNHEATENFQISERRSRDYLYSVTAQYHEICTRVYL